MAVELYKHNKEAYESVKKHFETSNKTCVIHPTGTGKSFISLKFIDDNISKNLLIMAPTNVILDQFCTNIAEQILGIETTTMSQKVLNDLVSNRLPNISFSTYANAKNQKKEYDCIVLDEFHRIGADTWGAGAKAIMDNNPDAKVLGMTATPIRYLDDMRDMSEEIFDGDIASQMTLPEAIVKGILPVPTYISTLYSFEEDIDEIQKQIDNYKDRKQAAEYQKLLDQAKKELQSSEGLDEIFARNILNKNGRFIVFCRNKEHMKEMEQKCLEWFKKTNPDIEISEVYSDQGKELNQYYIDYFENNKNKTLKLLFSIEMLNEGLHVDNIDGVVMFRPTVSPIIYMQQLGRALSVGHNEHPLIFDIVNNSSSLDSITSVKEQVEKLVDDIIIGRENGISHEDYPENDILLKLKDGFKVLGEQKEIIDVLESLKMDTKFTWDDCYILAKKYYEDHGNLEASYNYITKEGFKLGIWLHILRQIYKGKRSGILTSKQKELLEAIGMRFENLDPMEEWLKKYAYAKKYYEEFGDLEVQRKYVTKEGFKLGLWISSLRKTYQGKCLGEITPKQKELLEAIGMRFENIDLMEEWLKKYAYAKKYYEENGNLEVPQRFVTDDGFKLGSWISTIRQIKNGKNGGVLTEEQRKLLEAIGMRFDSKDRMESWLKKYAYAKKYYEENGDLEVPNNYITSDGFKLGSWISTIRQIKKGNASGTLTEEQKELLEAIGMRFDNKNQMESWLKKYAYAKKYYEENGNLEVPNKYMTEDGIKLGSWISEQRKLCKGKETNRITPEQIKLLEAIGMRFENIDRMESWLKKYAYAKKYYEENGDLDVSQRFEAIDGFKLGFWIGEQKKGYKGKIKITSEQIELLDKIGMKWFDDKTDDKLQSEEINEKNRLIKQKEILNRFYSLLCKYDENSLPSKEEISKSFVYQLNRKKK